jgi:hypothetical protein
VWFEVEHITSQRESLKKGRESTMQARDSSEGETSNIFALARALCRDNKLKVSRKERLTFALVELRDCIRNDFVKVAKGWGVSAQDLRRDYSYAYPVPAPGAPDSLCLENACEEVLHYLRSEIVSSAERYGVPDDVLERLTVDWLVSDQMGNERTPGAFFLDDSQGKGVEIEERLPSVLATLAHIKERAPAETPGTPLK